MSRDEGDTFPQTQLTGPGVQGSGLSGDPMLKRLVDLAHLGWSARLTLLSNGQILAGTLISSSQFRAALAESIRARRGADPSLTVLDSIVAEVIDAEEPPVPDPSPVPEPRFIHLAEVRVGPQVAGEPPTVVPFMRLRLPAVSGFWVTTREEPDEVR